MVKTLNKILFLFVLTLLFTTVSGWAQTNKEFARFYLKLSPSLNFESSKDVLNIEGISKIKQLYSFEISNAYSFSKAQIEQYNKQSKSNHTLKNTFQIEALLDYEASKNLLSAIQKLPNLVYAYQSNTTPIAPPHDIAPATDDLENTQGYIESNPGMNVRYAWNIGVNGAGINIRTLEYGINLNHEELDHTNASLAPNTTINTNATTAFTEHGTSVAGAVFGNKGSYGISGLAHGANEYVLYPEWTEEYGYNRILATSNAVANSSAGDVIIYEMQSYGQNDNFAPAEYEQAIWDLTKAATDAGIVIVAAAGNGSENLDDPFYNSYLARGDSGAIIVGAGTNALNHSPMSFSTYGSRVNIQSWGSGVSTIGDSPFGTNYGNDFNQSYLPSFNGTSSATALAGGFTAVLQSYYFAQTGGYLTSQELRTLMVNTGIAQGPGNNIGPIPNMQAAMLQLDNTLTVSTNSVSSFVMYPNPTKGILNINLNSFNNSATIEIYNLLGQQVLSNVLTKRNNTISVNNLTKGLYLVTIKTNNTTTTKKLIIN